MNARGRKIAKALLVKKLKPTLNILEKSIPLKVFKWTPLCHNVTSEKTFIDFKHFLPELLLRF